MSTLDPITQASSSAGQAARGGGVRPDDQKTGGGTMSTRDAALLVSRELGVDLSLRNIDTITRGWPLSKHPPVVGSRGQRAWATEHVDLLRETVKARLAKGGSL